MIHKVTVFRFQVLCKLTIKALIFPMLQMYSWYYGSIPFSFKTGFLSSSTTVIWGQTTVVQSVLCRLGYSVTPWASTH